MAPDDGKGQKLMESTHVEQNYLKKLKRIKFYEELQLALLNFKKGNNSVQRYANKDHSLLVLSGLLSGFNQSVFK